MKHQTIVIVNTACANLSSVQYAVQRLGYVARVSDEVAEIQAADKLIIPGVGTAKAAMRYLAEKDLLNTLRAYSRPVLGICLGMQLFSAYSDEGAVAGLNVIQADTVRLPEKGLPLPHMGWNRVHYQAGHFLFADIAQNSHFYFVHSYAVLPNECTIAQCDYGVAFSAALAKGNVYGVQFHPERSGRNGALLLRNFLEYDGERE